MKQLLENIKTGECYVEDVPTPVLRDGCVLVRNHYSLISAGTEGGTVKLGKMSLLGKARARPEQARKVIQLARLQGPLMAYQVAMRALETPVVLGYCCAGEVVAVGAGVNDLVPGDHVACGGAGHANHAEVVCVPKNLCVKLAADSNLRHAAFTTLGAVALQSVRVADVKLGENVVVIGLGLVGLLVVEILNAAGCRVFGIDVEPGRVDFVRESGMGEASLADASNLNEQVDAFTGGIGADSVLITAATENNAPVAMAGELARTKGRVVVVGRTEIAAPRDTYVYKELELRTSYAYGPGTGDPSYELDGLDYPVPYVRWTEKRNMAAFADLIARGSIALDKLITHEFPIEEASDGFDVITGKTGERSTAVLLRYVRESAEESVKERISIVPTRTLTHDSDVVRAGVIGAGSYATNEFLPLLKKQRNIQLRGIASAAGVNAKALAKKYEFAFCAAEAQTVIEDSDTDCVFILTRHDSHAPLTIAALEAGKHVFVEKPLALNHEELDRVEAAHRGSGLTLMVGFNRRYAALAVRLKGFFANRAQPMFVQYRANVGYRPPEHWLHHPEQGGGVIVGEACHHIDFCNWMVGAGPTEITAKTLGGGDTGFISEDSVHITLGYPDGSLASVTYLSNGCKAGDSERVEVHCDNKSAALTDYKRLELAKGLSIARKRLWLSSDKGHEAQIEDFLAATSGRRGSVIAARDYLDSSRASLTAAKLTDEVVSAIT